MVILRSLWMRKALSLSPNLLLVFLVYRVDIRLFNNFYQFFAKACPRNENSGKVIMARRVYYMDPARQRIKQEFLMSYRAAKKALDPRLLEEARDNILDAIIRQHEKRRVEQDGKKNETTIPVDRKQNLSVIMKYLEMNPGNQKVKEQLAIVLREDL